MASTQRRLSLVLPVPVLIHPGWVRSLVSGRSIASGNPQGGVAHLLRISTDFANGEVILHLEGEVTQPWTDELERIVTALLSEGKRIVLEMSEVRFVDAHAVDILHQWSESIALSDCTPFLKEALRVRTLRRE